MEAREELPNPKLINEYIETIKSLKSTINQEDCTSPFNQAIDTFLAQIKAINEATVKERIHVEKDLLPLLWLIMEPNNLNRIEAFYLRILENKEAYSRTRNIAGTAAGLGAATITGIGGMTLFGPPGLLTGIILYGTYAALAGSAVVTNTGICVGIDNSNKRGGLIQCEVLVLNNFLNELKSSNYAYYLQARLKKIMIDAHYSNGGDGNRDIIFNDAIKDIKNLALFKDNNSLNLEQILNTTKNNLEGRNENDVADEIGKLITELNELNCVSTIKNSL